jgi:hypothetical protein
MIQPKRDDINRICIQKFIEGISLPYIPEPIDTSHIQLPDDLLDLVELLAKNSHDNWAYQREKKGWTYGPRRDDKKKNNPCLIPYHELPESEKEYDRTLAKEILKTVILLGFRIEKEKKSD